MQNSQQLKTLGLFIVGALGLGLFFYFKSQQPVALDNSSQLAATIENAPEPEKVMAEKDELAIEMSSFQFSQDKIVVRAGQKVTLKLTNLEGVHDFMIDELGVASKQTSMGDETLVTFTVPKSSAGKTYEYYCSVGNHRQLGMVGQLVVESEKEAQTQSGGKYLIYTPEEFVAAADTRRVIYFYANWCPTCLPADKDFQENSDRLPKDVTVLRANYNDTDTDQIEKELAKKYGITYQHTFVQVDQNGKMINSWNGGQIDELLINLK